MLESPSLSEDTIAACVQDAFGLRVAQIAFLPLGADMNTAVYRALAEDGTPYFVKLRRADFDEVAVSLPKFLSVRGIEQIIPPLATRAGRLWADLDSYKVILYPFIEGHNGYEAALADQQWVDLGAALRRIHAAELPAALANLIPQETYSSRWRESASASLARVEKDTWSDPVAGRLAEFLKARRAEVLDLVGRAGRLAQVLQARSPELAVCHSDIHAGNVLTVRGGALYIVDWDNPILAPKERDLMVAGGGQFGSRRAPQEEELLFYRGYGPTTVDPYALAYYRYERIVDDIAVFCEQLLLSDEGGADREQSLRYLESNFLPGGTIDIAYRSDRTAGWA